MSLVTKRFGRTLTSEHSARLFAYEAHLVGGDRSPLAGNCQRPVILQITGFPDRLLFGLREGVENMDAIPNPRHVDLEVRCRKCENCLKARRQHWSMRAKAEIDASQRSWFGTLTLTPEKQFHLVASARSTLRRAGTNWDDLSTDEQFIETCKGLTREVQLYFKRLRKVGPAFRYLWTVERHKSGAPHVHLLVHEHAGPVRHRHLAAAWRWGFVKFNLVAEGQARNAANYVAKYLTKSLVKLAASKQYGVDIEPRTKPNIPPPPPEGNLNVRSSHHDDLFSLMDQRFDDQHNELTTPDNRCENDDDRA